MENRKVTKKDIEFGKRLARVRKNAGLTQEKLAVAAHLSVTFIGLVETGKRRPLLKTLERIASALKVSPKELF